MLADGADDVFGQLLANILIAADDVLVETCQGAFPQLNFAGKIITKIQV